MAPRDVIDCTKSHLEIVPVPTSLNLEATTLLKMLKTLLMMLKILELSPEALMVVEEAHDASCLMKKPLEP